MKVSTGFPLVSQTVGSHAQPVYCYMYTWYIRLFKTESKGNNNLQEDLVPIGARLGIKF